MGMIKVTSEDLQRQAVQIQQSSSRIEDELTALKSQIDTMTSGDWLGAASSQFQTLYTNWNTSATNMKQALDGISSLLTSTAQAYAQTEQDLASRIAGA
jgi:WXG100 family type VII secretion target